MHYLRRSGDGGEIQGTVQKSLLVGACIFGDSLGAFRDGVLGQLTRQQKTNGSLDFTGSDGGFLVVLRQTRSFSGDTFEDIVNERVHDGHGFRGNASVRMDLFEDFVDVDGVRFLPAETTRC